MYLSLLRSIGAGLSLASAMLLSISVVSSSYAQEVNPSTGDEFAVAAPSPFVGSGIELSYGFGVTTNYISKGLTQTDNGPAFQPYLELGYGAGYFGLWASNASFGGVEDTELDVSVGFRPEFGAVSLDVGFVQYFYQYDEADYGEAYLFAKYAVNDQVTLKGQYYREVYANKDWLYVGASTTAMPMGLTLSGGLGSDFGTSGFGEDSIAADIGISGGIGDNASYDFRLSDSSIEGFRFVAGLSYFN